MMTLIYYCFAWVLGILLSDAYDIPQIVALSLITGGGLGLWYFRVDRDGRLAAVCLILLGAGMLRFDLAQPDANENHIANLNDRGILVVEGVIVDEPIQTDGGRQFLLRAEQTGGRSREGVVLVRGDYFDELRYGDAVRVSGILRTPPDFDTFSYADYLARQNVFSAMYNAQIQVVDTEQGIPFYAALFDVKSDARIYIQDGLAEPYASLMVGMLLGDESGVAPEVRDNFTKTGTAHIIAISGFNMVILATVVMNMLKAFMKESIAVWIGVGVIILYTIFVGAGAAVVRAAVMSALYIVATTLKRRTFVPTSLAFATILMSLLDPYVLWDIGFQLSLAAVLGMAFFVPRFQRWTRHTLERGVSQDTANRVLRALAEPVLVTVAAQITTLPLILGYFGRLSIVSLPVNILIIPVQAPLLILGALGLLVSFASPSLGGFLLEAGGVCLRWSVGVIDTFAELSWADTEITLSHEWVTFFYVALVMIVLLRAIRPVWLEQHITQSTLPRRALVGAGLLVLLMVGFRLDDGAGGRLEITFFDVDQGNGVLIQTPQGATILVDGGRFPSRLLNQLGDALPPSQRHIDTLIVTAPNPDNIEALPQVMERYSIGAIGTRWRGSNEPSYQAILELAEAQDIPIVAVWEGYTIDSDDGVQVQVLSSQQNVGEEPLVLRVVYREAVVLLTGEMTPEVETRLLANPHLLQASVLQVAAHGDGDVSSTAFLQIVNPQVAVIQLDDENPPSPTVIERLDDQLVVRTDTDGKITIVSDGQQLWIHTANR